MLSPLQQRLAMNAQFQLPDQFSPSEAWKADPLWPIFDNMTTIVCGQTSPRQLPTMGFLQALEEIPDLVMEDEPLPASPADPVQSKQNTPTKEDWELHRPTIIHLYMDEDCTLPDVMQLMQTKHNFKATTKMYKSRFAAWHVCKYMTWAERETACRVLKAKQRSGEAVGKVVVRGKERNADFLRRHMGQSRGKRKRVESSPSIIPNEDLSIIVVRIESQSLRPMNRSPIYPAGPEKDIETISKEVQHLVLGTPDGRNTFSNSFPQKLDAA